MRTTLHRIRCADSRRLGFLEEGAAALVVTSPPYPMIEMWDEAFGRLDPEIPRRLEEEDPLGAFELMHRQLDAVWSELRRVTLPGGLVCVNVGDATRSLGGTFRLYPNAERITGSFRALGFDVLPRILWRKTTNAPTKFMGSGMLPPGAYVTLEHEYVLLFRREGRRELSSPQERRNRYQSALFWEERNRWFSDLWTALTGTSQRVEAASTRRRSGAYPLELPYRLVNMFSLKGDTVLDPFAGTGTTVLAAIAAGRHSVAVEIDPAFVELAGRRIRREWPALNQRLQQRLQAHLEFVRGRAEQGKTLRHRNACYGFAVMTRQESELCLEWVEAVEPVEDGFRARYCAERGLSPPGGAVQRDLFEA